jgi:hypothetical protein
MNLINLCGNNMDFIEYATVHQHLRSLANFSIIRAWSGRRPRTAGCRPALAALPLVSRRRGRRRVGDAPRRVGASGGEEVAGCARDRTHAGRRWQQLAVVDAAVRLFGRVDRGLGMRAYLGALGRVGGAESAPFHSRPIGGHARF